MKTESKFKVLSTVCIHCGSTFDQTIDELQVYCPFCGAELMLNVSKVSDILEEKKEIKSKGIKYTKDLKVKVSDPIDIQKKKKRRALLRRCALAGGIVLLGLGTWLWRFKPLF